ncbi:MAG: DciA family protein [Terriglobales bacterium]
MQALRDILPALAGDEAQAVPGELAAALAWLAAAGPDLASRVRACSLRDGVLSLGGADAATRAQIESVAPELLAALRRTPAGRHCQRLRFYP